MTSDEAHNSHHPLPSKPIRGQSEATNNLPPTSPENQLFDGFYFDDDKLCPQCGQDHSCKLTGGSAILEMISCLDRQVISDYK